MVPLNTYDIVSNEITLSSATTVTDFNIYYLPPSGFSTTGELDVAIYSISGSTATLVSNSVTSNSGGQGLSAFWFDAPYRQFTTEPVLTSGNYLLTAYCPHGGMSIGVSGAACTSDYSNYQIPGTPASGCCVVGNYLQYLTSYSLTGSLGVYTTTAGSRCYEMNIVTCP
jgi:hypothetical protein